MLKQLLFVFRSVLVGIFVTGVYSGPINAGIAAASQTAQAQDAEPQKTVPLTILTPNGKYTFQIELAQTNAERQRGLMFRHSLAPDGGMLFLFDHQDYVAMWMKNTFIPLDMFFIDRHGEIVNIAKQTEPRSLSIIRSDAPVSAVLELAGGTADRLKINPGDRIASPILKTE